MAFLCRRRHRRLYLDAPSWNALLAPLRTNLENLVFDQYQRWKPRPYDFDQPVRIVDIDDKSIHLDWPMALAAPDDGLARRGPRQSPCCGDWGRRPLSEKDPGCRATSEACAEGAGHRADEESRCQERADGDLAFAHAITDRPVVLGMYLTPTHNGSQASLTSKGGFSFIGDPPTSSSSDFSGVLVPIPDFAKAAAGLGFLNWLPDDDRVVRRVPLLLDVNGQIQPSLAVETLRVAQGASSLSSNQRPPSAAPRARAPFSRRSRTATSLFRFRPMDNFGYGSQSPIPAVRSRPGKCCSPVLISPILPARSWSSAPAPRCCTTSWRRRSIRRHLA